MAKAPVPTPPPSKPSLPRGLGHKMPEAPDPRDYRIGSMLGALRGTAPEVMTLAEMVPEVRDQGQTQSCVGHAVNSALELRLLKLGVRFRGSPLAAYTIGRMLGKQDLDETLKDEGSYASLVFKGLREWGVPADWEWQLGAEDVNEELPLDVLQGASRHRVQAWYRVDAPGRGRIDQLTQALGQGYPIAFAADVDRAFLDVGRKDSLVKAFGAERVGGHMMCIVGYTTTKGERVFRVLNSWGTGWGDAGLCWMTEAAILDASAGDFYAVQVG